MKNPRRGGRRGSGSLELGRWVLDQDFRPVTGTPHGGRFTSETILEPCGDSGPAGADSGTFLDADDLKRLAGAVEVSQDKLVVQCEVVSGDVFRFHGIVVCSAPKRGLVLVLLGVNPGESGARISPERAGTSGPWPGPSAGRADWRMSGPCWSCRAVMRPPWVKGTRRNGGSMSGSEC